MTRIENQSPSTGCCGDNSSGCHAQRSVFLAAGLITLATLAAFGNSFAASFVFDDHLAIEGNSTIRQLWPIGNVLCPPSNGETVSGRPVLNLSLALNYAVGGYQVCGYHVANLAIHLAAALLLFGIIRRTAATFAGLRPGVTAPPDATSIALAVALLWAVHPLQTESVTYVVQRAESLMGLFYLLTLYCFLRGAGSQRAIFWHAGSVLACLLGMATKEVMVSAPLIVLLYDRTFLAGSFRAAWRRRRGYYLSLAATWLLLAWLVARTGLLPRSFGEHADPTYEFTSWTYLVTQVGVIAHYLRQAFWPAGLCLNYCWPAATVSDVLLPAIPVIGLLGLTAWALVKQPAWGFLGAWFFLILAPTSSVLPVLESAAYEHRMYLPLAAVVTGIVAGACLAGQWLARRGTIPPATLRAVGACMAACAAIALGIATFQRNKSYRSDLSIWQDAVAKAPGSYLAHNNLGLALVGRGQADAAIPQFLNALKIKPDCTQARGNLGGALAGCGQADEAITQFRKVLEITPDSAEIHYNLGVVLASRGQVDEAATHFRKALEIQPDFADARRNLEAARTRQQ